MPATTITPNKSLSSFMDTFTKKSSRKAPSACIDTSTRTEATEMTELSDSNEVTCKNVRFYGSVYVQAGRSHHNYTPKERRACWYDNDEYNCIRNECVKQIWKMNQGGILKDKKYCSRGLEIHVKQTSIARGQNRRAAIYAVLDEQEAQWQLEVVDEEAIAARYQETASSALLRARSIALRDQREQYVGR